LSLHRQRQESNTAACLADGRHADYSTDWFEIEDNDDATKIAFEQQLEHDKKVNKTRGNNTNDDTIKTLAFENYEDYGNNMKTKATTRNEYENYQYLKYGRELSSWELCSAPCYVLNKKTLITVKKKKVDKLEKKKICENDPDEQY